MSAGQSWFYSISHLAGASLIAAIYVGGLVVALRRWHLGMAPRLAAVGFGLLLLGLIGQQVFSFLSPLLSVASNSGGFDDVYLRIMLVNSIVVLLSGAGYVLIVLALRTALRDCERARSGTPETRVWLTDDEQGR